MTAGMHASHVAKRVLTVGYSNFTHSLLERITTTFIYKNL